MFVSLWWLTFWTAVGLCIGSFLNAVIYRLPRQGSLRIPRWSACPNCSARIAWYDNLPILSFVLLRGRCRRCARPIATRYLVVEAAMAIVLLMILDAFFVGQVRTGLSKSPFGLTDDLSQDWPIFIAHVLLFSCLLSMSAIDLEHYWVDIRFTYFATLCGFGLHALWTPVHSKAWTRPSDTTAVASLLAILGLALVWMFRGRHQNPDDSNAPRLEADGSEAPMQGAMVPVGQDTVPSQGKDEPVVDRPTETPPTPIGAEAWTAHKNDSSPSPVPSRFLGGLAVALLAALFVTVFAETQKVPTVSWLVRGIGPLLFLFVLVLRESTVQRESDQEIIEAIEQERFSARRMVLGELLLLLPAWILAAAGVYLMFQGSDLSIWITERLHTTIRVPGLNMMRSWSPLWGLATAASGYIIAGALGWIIRIGFTLVFGKEAFGTGDIHLMAAAGCVVGWPVAVLGFFAATGLAMLGWLLALPFKRPRALPLGPWLSLAFLSVVVFYEDILRWPLVANVIYETRRFIQLLG